MEAALLVAISTAYPDSVAAAEAAGQTLEGLFGIDPASAIGQIFYPFVVMVVGYLLTLWKKVMAWNPNIMPKVGVGVMSVLGVGMYRGQADIETLLYGLGMALAGTGAWEWGGGWIAKNIPWLKNITAKYTGLKFDGTKEGT